VRGLVLVFSIIVKLDANGGGGNDVRPTAYP